MADLVVDSSVWVASFLPEDLHHSQATQFVDEFRAGAHHCHLPYLVLVETCAAIARQVQAGRMAYVSWVRQSFEDWKEQGLVSWYDFDQQRAEIIISFNLSFPNPLKGGDSVVASLSDELGYTLKTFDKEILDRYSRAAI